MRKVSYVCDICKSEIDICNEKRIKLGFGSGDWEDDSKVSYDEVLDMCSSCRETLLDLLCPESIGRIVKKTAIATEKKPVEDIDEKICNMYNCGYTAKEISKKLNFTHGQVTYAISKGRKNGKVFPKRINKENIHHSESNKMVVKTVVDESGCVLKTEFA